jgi:hypothetical protein
MTKKDYKLIAEAIYLVGDSKRLLIERLAAKLKEDNPKFNVTKFVKACWYGSWTYGK